MPHFSSSLGWDLTRQGITADGELFHAMMGSEKPLAVPTVPTRLARAKSLLPGMVTPAMV